MLDSQLFVLGGSPEDIRFSAGQWARFFDCNLTASGEIGRMDLADFRGDETGLHHAKLHGQFVPALDVTGLAWSRAAAALSTYAHLVWKACCSRMVAEVSRAPVQFQGF